MNLRNEILDKILTPVQYGKQDYKVPFVFNLRNQSVGLFYYGTEHSQDPNNSKFSDIESSLKKFIESYSSSSVHVAVETSIPQEIFDRDDTIRKHKESGFLVFLAKKYGVDVFCPEPGEQIIPLLLLFSKATPIDIAVWILLNSLVYNFSFNKLFSIHHIQDATATIARFIPDVTYLLLCQHLKWAIGQTLIPETEEELVLNIQKINFKLAEELLNPFVATTIFNIISSDFRNVRDRFIAQGIIDVLDNGKSVFAVFGTNHAIAQEPAFRYFFENSKSNKKNTN